MGNEQIKTRRDAQALILERALREPAFRFALTADPRAAIEQALGLTLPSEVRVTVVEETDREIYLVLPAKPARELSDSELAAVSGGRSGFGEKAGSRMKKGAAEAGQTAKLE